MKKAVTIHDISAHAGVSIATVSRFLNGNYKNMSEQTRSNLERIVRELDYHPNGIARSLKSQNSRTVGCVLADLGSPFSALLIKGIQAVCRSHGYKLLIMDADNDPVLETEAFRALLNNPVEGIICNTTGQTLQEIEALAEKIPLVLADRVFSNGKDFDCVISDNAYAVHDCMHYLREQGYERAAFFTPPFDFISTRRERAEAFCSGYLDYFGISGKANLFIIDMDSVENTSQLLYNFVSQKPNLPSALFCVNGEVTLHLIEAIHTSGLELSSALGLCGFDDWPWMRHLDAGITSISTDTVSMGAKSAELLFARIRGGPDAPACRIIMQHQRVERASTKRD